MTPKEASETFCPYTRDSKGDGAPCLGPDCKAGWRWQYMLSVENPTRAPGMARQTISKKRGYCGAFGRP